MSLQAREFFAELCLPFRVHAVVGDTYYATPIPGTPLRLRIDFNATIHADTYGGLRLAVLHPDRGEIDAVALVRGARHFPPPRRSGQHAPQHQAVRHLRHVPPPRAAPVGRSRHHRVARRHRAVHRHLVPRRLDREHTEPSRRPNQAHGPRYDYLPQRCPRPLKSAHTAAPDVPHPSAGALARPPRRPRPGSSPTPVPMPACGSSAAQESLSRAVSECAWPSAFTAATRTHRPVKTDTTAST